jgi:hypothetical protein
MRATTALDLLPRSRRTLAFSADGLAYANAAIVAQIFAGERDRPSLARHSSPIRRGIRRSGDHRQQLNASRSADWLLAFKYVVAVCWRNGSSEAAETGSTRFETLRTQAKDCAPTKVGWSSHPLTRSFMLVRTADIRQRRLGSSATDGRAPRPAAGLPV